MRQAQSVYSMGPLLDEYTMGVINKAKTENEERKEKMQNKFVNNEGRLVESTLNNMPEIKGLLKKAGISLRYFPFVPVKDRNGNIERFAPKGSDIKEIKEDIEKYKEKLESAFKKGKLTEEEYETLQQNLDELMTENDIDLEEANNLEVTDAEVNDYLNATIYRNFGDNYDLNGIKESYEAADLDGKKSFLSKMNSEINKKVGISGKLTFVNDSMPINFENSFTADGKGYMLSNGDIDVSADELRGLLYSMVERSLMRKHEIENAQMMSPEKKRELHEKIMRDKEKREKEEERRQDKFNREQQRKLIRRLERE